jgi:2-dehydro-3-deoxygluconokinase
VERHGFTYKILDYEDGDEACIKSAAISIEGENAYGLLKSENGVHRLVRVSPFDANARRQTSFAAIEVMPEIAKYIDVMIANEEDCQKCLGIELETGVDSGKLDTDMYKQLAKIVMDTYPNVKALAVSLRESISADHNNWSGVLAIRDGGFYQSRKYSITNIVDRIGGGDSFGGSLIYGFRNFDNDYQKIIEYAIGGSALKHTTYGDYVRFTKEDVLNLIAGSGNGRIQR